MNKTVEAGFMAGYMEKTAFSLAQTALLSGLGGAGLGGLAGYALSPEEHWRQKMGDIVLGSILGGTAGTALGAGLYHVDTPEEVQTRIRKTKLEEFLETKRKEGMSEDFLKWWKEGVERQQEWLKSRRK